MSLYHMTDKTREILIEKKQLLECVGGEENPLLHSKHGYIYVINTTYSYKGIIPSFKVGMPLIIDDGENVITLPSVTEINWEYNYLISDNVFYSFNFTPVNLYKLIDND